MAVSSLSPLQTSAHTPRTCCLFLGFWHPAPAFSTLARPLTLTLSSSKQPPALRISARTRHSRLAMSLADETLRSVCAGLGRRRRGARS
eukprot:864352-Rhodomonas_salina.1